MSEAASNQPPTDVNSISELTRRNVETVAELENEATARRGHADRIADAISGFVGSMAFVYLHIAWFGLWIAVNQSSLAPRAWRFDPFPFTFLTFIVSLEAIFLSTFILISQKNEETLAKRRSHLDLQINLLSEQENSKILEMLEALHVHLGIAVDPETKTFKEITKPEELAEKIESAIDECPRE